MTYWIQKYLKLRYSLLLVLIVSTFFLACKNDKETNSTKDVKEVTVDSVKVDNNLVDTNDSAVDSTTVKDIAKKDSTKTKSIEDMQSLFSKMFDNTEKEQRYYTLNDIEFNTKDHRIASYSKTEFLGLANALKSRDSGKIEVQVYTNDSKSSRKNKKLSKDRAKLIIQMLKTLGVNEKQLSAKGMGDSDKEKATVDRVEIEIK